jgi:hypothetical protein
MKVLGDFRFVALIFYFFWFFVQISQNYSGWTNLESGIGQRKFFQIN